jgi:ribosomal-protein-serine acetyltransferase
VLSIRVDDELSLGLLEERHADELFALTERNREHLRRWLPWVDAVVVTEDTRHFLRQSLEQLARGDGFQAGIWLRGKLVGVIGYHQIKRANRYTEIGYWLDAKSQGQGVMTRACRAMVSYAFEELGLNRVEIHCATGNTRSCAVPERLGFTREGVRRQAEWIDGAPVDHALYAVLAEEWR